MIVKIKLTPEEYADMCARGLASPTCARLVVEVQAAKSKWDRDRVPERDLRVEISVSGLWTQQVTRWLDMERWNDEGASSPLPDLSGQECWGGLDLASTIDLAALVLAFRDPGDAERVCLVCRFWCPEERVLERARRDMAPYDAWVRDGLLTATPGDTIDYEAIRAEVVALSKRYRIREVAFDRWNASQLVTQLQGDGLTMVQFGQGFASMTAPAKELERLVTGRKLRHGGNAPLRWMASNVAVQQDPAGNLKPDRQRSGEKIDGIVAACMALGRLGVQGGEGAERV